MSNYYNEIDPFAAEWLRKLITAGHIAPGEVDTRSIEDVLPADLAGFVQCHFFAGIGVWSYALRRAGWPDDRPVWTGSCPCQPFSAAGKGEGFADERHLWPAFFHLVSQCRPVTVFGEQVASKDGLAWFDLVQADLAQAGYACGVADTCAAGFGAPHIRQRLYWVAKRWLENPIGQRSGRGLYGYPESSGGEPVAKDQITGPMSAGRMADAASPRHYGPLREAERKTRDETRLRLFGAECEPCGMGDALSEGLEGYAGNGDGTIGWPEPSRSAAETGRTDQLDNGGRSGSVNGFWRDADWLFCRDGKWRPTQSFPEPLADGLADSLGYRRLRDRCALDPLKEKAENRVGRLRGYGNAINAVQAEEFIRAYMDVYEIGRAILTAHGEG